MHILIIPSEEFMTKKTPFGGIFQWHQAKALSVNGFQVGIINVREFGPKILFKKNRYSAFEEIEGIPIYRNYKVSLMPPRYKSIKQNIDDNYKIAKKLLDIYINKYGKPDIIHAHNFYYAGLISQKIKENYKIPYIVTEHSSSYARGIVDNKFLPFIIKSSLQASITAAVSSPFVSILKNKLNNENIKLLPNIVDKSFFEKNSIVAKYKQFTFLNIASLDENKNHKLLLNSFSLSFKNKNIYLHIAGEGTLLDELKELALNLGIDKQVKFLGRLSQDKAKEEMSKSHCFVLSSKYETFGVVLIESLACGVPIIATRCGGPEDIVDKRNGILVEVNDEVAFSKAMQNIKNNLLNYDKKTIVKDTKEKFGEKAFVNNVKKYYMDILGLNNDNNS